MLDFLLEYRYIVSDRKLHLEKEVIDCMENFAEEGLIISKGKLHSPKQSAFQFLYMIRVYNTHWGRRFGEKRRSILFHNKVSASTLDAKANRI